MPTSIKQFRSGLNRIRETLFKGLFRARFRYDVFISYNHQAKGYAVNLKKQLADLDFSCFIDQEESPPGLSLDPTLEKALSKSAVLVLLATERALTRPYISLEFEKFVATGRRIIPINISDALTQNNEEALARTPWNIIKTRKLIWIDEVDESFAKEMPSPPIADGIDKLFKYTRRNSRVRTEIIGTAVLVVLAAIGAGFVIKGKAAEVSKQAGLAELAKTETIRQQGNADKARIDAETQQGIARTQKLEAEKQGKLALDAKNDAKHQQELAETAAAEAQKQQGIAKAAKLEADRQQAIAKEQLERVKHLSYVSDVNFAQRAYDADNVPRADEFLNARVPQPASPKLDDLRGFEWYYLWRLRHNEIGTLNGQSGAVREFMFAPDGKTAITTQDGSGNSVKLWNASTWQEIGGLEGDSGTVKSVTFSPDSRMLAVEYAEQSLKIWDASSRKQLWTPAGLVGSVAFSADSKMLATGSSDPIVKLWDTTTHQKIAELKVAELKVADSEASKEVVTGRRQKPEAPEVSAIKFSPSGKLLVTATNKNQLVKLWDAATGKELMTLTGEPSDGSFFMEFSPDGKLLVTGGSSSPVTLWDSAKLTEPGRTELGRFEDGAFSVTFSPDGKSLFTGFHDLKIWDTSTCKELGTLRQLSDDVDVEVFSPDGQMLATGGSKSTVKLWDLTGHELASLKVGKYAMESVAFSADGGTLAARSNDGAMKFWDVSTPEGIGKLKGYGDSVSSVMFSPADKLLVAVDGGIVKWWDTSSQRELATFDGNSPYLSSVEFLNNGRTLGTRGKDDSMKLWDTATRHPLNSGIRGKLRLTGNPIAFSGDGKTVAVGYLDSDNSVKLLESLTLQELGRLPTQTSKVHSLEFSPDGKTLVTGDDDIVTVWDTKSLTELRKLKGHKLDPDARLFSPDGKILATAAEDNQVKLWDTTTWKELATLAGNSSTIRFLIFSLNGATLATVDPSAVILWDTKTRKKLTAVSGQFDESATIALSPDGKILAIRNRGLNDVSLKLVNRKGEEYATLRGQLDISSVAFSPDGKTLASGGTDGTVKLWETVTGQELVAFKAHSSKVVSLSFSPDSKILATVSIDKTKTVKLWYAATETEVTAAQKRSMLPAP